MCRFVAYLGEPIFLEDLIAKPRHSLMRQSLRAEEAKTVTNGDGFGVGWYGDRDEVPEAAGLAWIRAALLAEPSETTPLVLPFFTGERSTGWAAGARCSSTWR